MKILSRTALSLLVLAGFALAEVNGKFVAERETQRGKMTQTFDLKSEGSTLKGTVKMQFGDMDIPEMQITDGKVDGNKVKFTTVMQGPQGEMKQMYEATVDGDTMKGTVSREGGEGRPFEAKKK